MYAIYIYMYAIYIYIYVYMYVYIYIDETHSGVRELEHKHTLLLEIAIVILTDKSGLLVQTKRAYNFLRLSEPPKPSNTPFSVASNAEARNHHTPDPQHRISN